MEGCASSTARLLCPTLGPWMTALPHQMRARTVADRSSKCAAPSSMSVGSAYSRGVVRRRLILGSWPFQPAVAAMLVGVWGGDGGGSGVAHSPWAHPRRPTATRAGGGHGPWVSSSPFGAATTFNEARARWFVLSEARCGSQWSFFCSLTIVHTVPSSDVGEAAGREEEGGRG